MVFPHVLENMFPPIEERRGISLGQQAELVMGIEEAKDMNDF